MLDLQYQNEKLKDQLDHALSQAAGPENLDELSIFQSKTPYQTPQLDLVKMQREETNQKDYVKKLE